jgi:hypothetical protein
MATSVLQVRDFPDDLKRDLKMIGLLTDRPLKDVIIDALTEYVKVEKKKRG